TDFVRALAEALREGTAVIEPGRRRPKPAPPTLPPPFSLTLPIRQPNRRPAPRPAPQRRWLLGAALRLGGFGLVGLVLPAHALSAPDQNGDRSARTARLPTARGPDKSVDPPAPPPAGPPEPAPAEPLSERDPPPKKAEAPPPPKQE